MLTVKWCCESNGVARERVFETPTVDAAFPNQSPNGGPKQPPMLGIYSVPDGGLVVIGNSADGADSMAFAFGTVYVMNEHGKTVTTYRLPPEPPWDAKEKGAPSTAMKAAA